MSVTKKVSDQKLNKWTTEIENAWQKSVESVVEVGRLVKKAKEELGVSFSLLETKLPFSSTVAAFLVKIAENPVLSNPAYHNKLPNGYNTLYHLAGVDQNTLVDQLNSGEITPNLTLEKAKKLRDKSGDVLQNKKKKPNRRYEPEILQVGVLSIEKPKYIDEFEKELGDLILKYNGSISWSKSEGSLIDFCMKSIHSLAMDKIRDSERKLNRVSLDELRILEDAAHYLTKERNRKNVTDIDVNGKIVERSCLPDDYKDLVQIRKLIGEKIITRGVMKKWCAENKVPNQFIDLSSIDKDLYVWEQVRLITAKIDVSGGMKRLKGMASHSTNPKIKALAEKALLTLAHIDKKD